MKVWTFDPLDSCFFRGAKPFNQGEGGFLDSQFPPTAQTMAGVIRSAIAEARGVDWHAFRKNEQPHISELIGLDSDDPGQLTFAGPYLMQGGARLYPAPLHLLYSEREHGWGKLQPAKQALKTDKGMRRLPEVVQPAPEAAKPLEHCWLDEGNFKLVLQGKNPQRFFRNGDLFIMESRTGIGRDNEKRKTEEGLLYFTRHIRLKEGVQLAMSVNGADDIRPARMLRLGGEGRMANVQLCDAVDSCLRGNNEVKCHAAIILLTHGDFNGKSEPVWPQGVELISACIGKAVREGGWDYKKRKPKPLKSLVPAGSVYFVKGDVSRIRALGERTEFGYGEIAIGEWEEKQ